MKRTIFLALVLGIIAIIPSVDSTHDPNDFFTLEAAFPGAIWKDVHGTSSSNVIAVGVDASGNGVAARWNGVSWTGIGTSLEDNRDLVWVQSTTLAFAGADSRNTGLSRWTGGTSWASTSIAGITEGAAFGVSATQILLGKTSTGGTPSPDIAAWDGSAGTVTPVACTDNPVNSETISWMFARPGGTRVSFGITQYLGTGTMKIASRVASTTFSGVTCPDSGYTNTILEDGWRATENAIDTITVGNGGAIFTGETALVPVVSPTQSNLHAIWGTSATNIWAVGDQGTIIHTSDGLTWTTEPSLSVSENLQGVYFSDASNGWIVSESGNIFRLRVNAPVTHPNLSGINFDPLDHTIAVTQAQCLGDDIEFTVIADAGTVNDMDVYIIEGETDVVIEQIDDSQMFAIANKWWHFNRTYPAGSYQALSIVDIQSILSPDTFAVAPFNVPAGSCYTAQDALLIQNRFDGVDASLANLTRAVEYVNQTTIRIDRNETNDFVYSNALQNSTTLTITDLIGSVHVHLDSHFAYTNNLMNTSFATINSTIILNANFSDLQHVLNQTFTAQSVPIAESIDAGVYAWGVFFILLGLIVWAEYTRETLIYVLAILACVIVVFALPTGFLAYRLIISLTILLLAARAYFGVSDNES
jgi:hypothetical protein